MNRQGGCRAPHLAAKYSWKWKTVSRRRDVIVAFEFLPSQPSTSSKLGLFSTTRHTFSDSPTSSSSLRSFSTG